MNMFTKSVLLPLAAVGCYALVGSFAIAENTLSIEPIDTSALTYKTSPRWPDIRTAIVTGNPIEPGLYTTHAWMADGSVVPPHTHPDPRITVVTHGTMYVGVGSRFEESTLVAYPAGSIFITPADVPHFMWAKDGDTAVLDSGAGPTGITIQGDGSG